MPPWKPPPLASHFSLAPLKPPSALRRPPPASRPPPSSALHLSPPPALPLPNRPPRSLLRKPPPLRLLQLHPPLPHPPHQSRPCLNQARPPPQRRPRLRRKSCLSPCHPSCHRQPQPQPRSVLPRRRLLRHPARPQSRSPLPAQRLPRPPPALLLHLRRSPPRCALLSRCLNLPRRGRALPSRPRRRSRVGRLSQLGSQLPRRRPNLVKPGQLRRHPRPSRSLSPHSQPSRVNPRAPFRLLPSRCPPSPRRFQSRRPFQRRAAPPTHSPPRHPHHGRSLPRLHLRPPLLPLVLPPRRCLPRPSRPDAAFVPSAPAARTPAAPLSYPSRPSAGAPPPRPVAPLSPAAAAAPPPSPVLASYAPPAGPQRAQAVAPTAPPPQPAAEASSNGGDVMLDGARVGRWMAAALAEQAARPPSGPTFFDPSQSPAWNPAGAA